MMIKVKNISFPKKEICLLLCSTLISVTLAGLFFWNRNQAHQISDYDVVLDFDPRREGGHLLPNLDMLMQGEFIGQGVRIITNSKGFRSEREYAYDPAPRTYRILFLGDSFVDGHRTDQRKTIGYLLEQALNQQAETTGFDKVEVLISGHNNPVNAWYYFQEHGVKYHPNLVILGVTLSNDLAWHSFRSDMIPLVNPDKLVTLEWSGRYYEDFSCLPDLLLPDDAFCSDELLGERRRSASEKVVLGDGVLPVINPGKSEKRKVYAAGFSCPLGLFYVPVMPAIEKMYQDFEEVIGCFADNVRSGNTELLVILFPLRIQVYDAEWYRLSQEYALDETKFDLSYPNHRISRTFASQNIQYNDPLPTFRQFAETQNQALFRSRGDSHFNERGQALVADSLASNVATLMQQESSQGE